jgi:hypothetical protein
VSKTCALFAEALNLSITLSHALARQRIGHPINLHRGAEFTSGQINY